MGRNFTLSLLVHAVIFAVAYFGVPAMQGERAAVDVPVSVEIVTVADVTNVPSKPKKVAPKPKQKPKPKPKPPPPPPAAPQGAIEKPPVPDPVVEKPKAEAVIVPEPEPAPKPAPEPKKAEVKKLTPAPIPPRKPKAPDSFESVLKTLEQLKKEPPPPPKPDPAVDFSKMMENALDTPTLRNDVGPVMTISEIDLVRQQIHRCWNLPAGAKDAHKMLISIRVVMNPDGHVRAARVLGQQQMSSDPFYRAMAESALRAVLNPRCQPFKLPLDKYDRWQTMLLNFDPKEMFGL